MACKIATIHLRLGMSIVVIFSFLKYILEAYFLSLVGFDGIYGPPSYIRRFVGEDALLMWNTTNHSIIRSAIFGLSKDGMPDPQFINVNTLTGKVNYNPKMPRRYYGRVEFIGKLTAGHAWFIISNLQINDSNEYIARITVDASTVKSHIVRLVVLEARKGS
jgi:hypothetical protein